MESEVEDNFKVSQNIQKKNHFVIKYIIFLIVLIILTALAIFITIDKINKDNQVENISAAKEIKELSGDEKYTISSYTDTYDNNDIKIIKYYDLDGNITTDIDNYSNYKKEIGYLHIQGLKNKKIQNDINKKLKEKAYNLNGNHIYSDVTANFANILSVIIYDNENKTECLNVNLATGEDIKLEDLFLPSTPINLYLTNSLYETLAWQSVDLWEGDNDLSKVDMSDYEDKFMILINNYNNKKNDLVYTISANEINIYGLIDKKIIDNTYAEETMLSIDLIKYMDEVTMYKKFLTNESIYEDNSIGLNKTIVFTDGDEDFETRLYYGNLQDNIFYEEVVLDYDKEFYNDSKLSVARKFIEKLSKETKEELKKTVKSNRGVFFQREYQPMYDEERNYTIINIGTYQASCSTSYFKNDAFLDYIKLKAMPRGDAVLQGFSEYQSENFPNLSIQESKFDTYYLDEEGNIIARSFLEMEEKSKQNEMKNEINNVIINTIVTNTLEENNITNTTNTTKTDNNTISNNTTKENNVNVNNATTNKMN